MERSAPDQACGTAARLWMEATAMPETLGYARVSTADQDITGQLMRLADAGATHRYQDVVSGRVFERPGLAALLVSGVTANWSGGDMRIWPPC